MPGSPIAEVQRLGRRTRQQVPQRRDEARQRGQQARAVNHVGAPGPTARDDAHRCNPEQAGHTAKPDKGRHLANPRDKCPPESKSDGIPLKVSKSTISPSISMTRTRVSATELRQQFRNCAKLRSLRWSGMRPVPSVCGEYALMFRTIVCCAALVLGLSLNAVAAPACDDDGCQTATKSKPLDIMKFMREQAASTRVANTRAAKPQHSKAPTVAHAPRPARRAVAARPKPAGLPIEAAASYASQQPTVQSRGERRIQRHRPCCRRDRNFGGNDGRGHRRRAQRATGRHRGVQRYRPQG